jgi:outer membrane protein assembly factor BamD
MRRIEVGMSRRIIASVTLFCALLLAGCHHKVQNPMANINSKQPDKELYDRAMDSMKHGKYTESRTLLETMINAYPDSEYIARAKLALGDSWYAEGGKTAWQQAEVQYKDFQTFFPNMPEAAEAQLKVANMHYQQMEKADRDYAEAVRASDEYKALIQRYPDNPLVPQAKQRLREVQEDLAERQFRIAHFYFLRDNLAAAQARLQSLVDSYPLYSAIDEALFELGALYEKEAAAMRRQPGVNDAKKEAVAALFQKHAIDAYSRIVTRYPAKARVNDARHRLQALNAPVPVPTAEALAQSKAEEQSRHAKSMTDKVLDNFRKRPDMAKAPGVGEPNMSDEATFSAVDMLKDLNQQLRLGVEPVGGGTGAVPGANQPPPSSTSTPANTAPANPAGGSSTSASSTAADPAAGSAAAAGSAPAGSAATASASPSSEGAAPPAAPAQVNEAPAASSTQSAQTTNGSQSASNKQDSTSKKKKKTGLRKIIPF